VLEALKTSGLLATSSNDLDAGTTVAVEDESGLTMAS